jgi:hypothetical protein
MRLGVPFIAPSQLGAVENKSGGPSLPSVVGRTGQSGAHRTLSSALISFLKQRSRPLPTVADLAHRTVRCTPDSPVPHSDRWHGHVSGADRAADRWLGRPLAHRTVRCTPDSLVNYSRTPSANSRERPFRPRQPGAPDPPFPPAAAGRPPHWRARHRTVRCPRPKQPFGCTQPTLLFFLLSVSNT